MSIKTVIFCDRCGAQLEKMDRDSGNRYMELRMAPARELDNSWELCGKCVRELKEWMKI